MLLEVLALSLVTSGLLAGCWIVARLSGQIDALLRDVRQMHDQHRTEMKALQERVDDTHRKLGRLEVIAGGRGRHE